MFNVQRQEQNVVDRMTATSTPGIALAAVLEGEVVYARGFGVTSVEDPRPVTPETLFQIGSTTKPLTGTMLIRLVEQGMLELDRPIVSWLSELRFREPDAAKQVTLRLLLSHTAGLPWDQITPHRLYGRRDPQALADWVRDELPGRPLVAPPGTRFSYSNPGICLAARVAEVAAGEWYADLMKRLVFAPLGMERTTFDSTVAMTWPLAQPHEQDADGAPALVHRFPDNAAHHAAAFAFSTVIDLASFAILHARGGRFGGERLLAAESIAAMHAPAASCDDGTNMPNGLTFPGMTHGLTFFVEDWRGVRRVSHQGGISGFGCQWVVVPEREAAAVLLYNQAEFGEVAGALVDDLLGEMLGRHAHE